jgi:hypothetical protein
MNALRILLVAAAAIKIYGMRVFPGVRLDAFTRKCVGIVGCATLTFASPYEDAKAIPALEAATRAMTEKKERVVEERDVSSLPEASKKRKALALCKESSARRAAGYSSASSCTEAVMQGKYNDILNGVPAAGEY